MKLNKIFILLIFLFISSEIFAQKVGLVLSGGGAKGLYHIGVIKALEENEIPIDYVSGTSIGAIIGGLYAMGMSTERMYEEFSSSQVRFWMTGKIEPKYEYYFKRMRNDASLLTMRLDLTNPDKSKRAQIPANIIQSSQLDLAFVEYFSSAEAACEGDFDKLFVPFRCVATDAYNRQGVIYRSGNLSRAVRASMTLPFMYKPIKGDSSVLYDGGMYNNFPWQVLDEDFAPDILIGSKCVDGNPDPEKNNLMDQVFSLTMMHTDYNLRDSTDVLIEHIFNDVGMLDFAKIEQVVAMGYEDTMEQMDKIKSRVGRRVTKQQMRIKRSEYKKSLPVLIFDDYHITGLKANQEGYIHKQLKINTKDEYFTINRFRSEYFKILSEGQIESDFPQVNYNKQKGLFDINLDMHTKPSFKLLVGGNISSTALNQAYIGLEYKTISNIAMSYNLDFSLSSFYSLASYSSRLDFFIKQPFYFQYGISYNYYNYFRSDFGMLSKYNDLTYSKFEDAFASFELGTPININSVVNSTFNFGMNSYHYYLDETYSDVDTMDNTRFKYVGIQLQADRGQSNYRIYPTSGILQSLSLVYIFGNETLDRGGYQYSNSYSPEAHREWFGIRFKREQYFSFDKPRWLSLGYMVDGILTNHPDFFNDYATKLSSPAFTPTPHSKLVFLKEYRAPSFLGLGVIPIFKFSDTFYLRTSTYLFIPEDYNNVELGERQRLRYIFDVTLCYQSLLGPVSLSLSKYDVSNNNWFLSFNFGFSLFGERGLFY